MTAMASLLARGGEGGRERAVFALPRGRGPSRSGRGRRETERGLRSTTRVAAARGVDPK